MKRRKRAKPFRGVPAPPASAARIAAQAQSDRLSGATTPPEQRDSRGETAPGRAVPDPPYGDGIPFLALTSWRVTFLAVGLIALSALGAYCNSLDAAFVGDDGAAIVDNPTIRQLWPFWIVLSPPSDGATVEGRPLLNVSLAINYALGGLNVWDYHATNLAIHIATALLLLGVVRRTLLTARLRDRFGRAATPLALASALLWVVHPLHTESVTYIVQRAESLMGFFYLLTLYCVIRGAGTVPFSAAADPASLASPAGEKGDCPPSPSRNAGVPPAQADAGETPPGGTDSSAIGVPQAQEVTRRPLAAGAAQIAELSEPPSSIIPRLWYAGAVLACLLGMATKEVMVTAPLVVLLYDRTFLSGSFARAWRRRWGLYLGLAATWGLLACLVGSTRLVFRQAEMGAPTAWSYARSQPGVILHYLRLSIWPNPLCFSYDWPVASSFGEIAPGTIVVGLLLAATVWGVVKGRGEGFLGAWFFLILAPTCSILPLGQLAFEHRMYLSLAAVVVLAVAGGYALGDGLFPHPVGSEQRSRPVRWAVPLGVLAITVVAFGSMARARNWDYRSPLAIWEDVVAKRPNSPLGHNNLGFALAEAGRAAEAMEHYREALRLRPDYAPAHNYFGLVLVSLGQTDEAMAHLREALRLAPDSAEIHNNLGVALANAGKPAEALEPFREAVRLKTDFADAHSSLGLLLAGLHRTDEAIEHLRQALRRKPAYVESHTNLANVLVDAGNIDEAIEHYQQALRLSPTSPMVQTGLAATLAAAGRTDEALEHYHEALRLKPDYPEAHNNLAALLLGLGRTEEAIAHYDHALRLRPDYARAHSNLGFALGKAGRTDEAIAHLQEALRLEPDYANAHCNLAQVLASVGKLHESIKHYHRFLELAPDSQAGLHDLAWLLATHDPAAGGDPARAVELAQRARELAGQENAQCLDTLAAAYAAAGRFDDAVMTAERAIQLAEAAGQTALAKNIQARLNLYRAGRPYRQPPRSAAQPDP